MHRRIFSGLLAVLFLSVFLAVTGASAEDTSFARIERGRHLVTAGDCIACHTADASRPFAGGRAIPTPFGTIYSPNITPDRETGIGSWSDEDFYRAMHSGVGPDGTHLYPAFPYPYFTKMPRRDVLAVRAYLSTLKPFSNERREADLIWPFNYRFLMRLWNWAFFDEGVFRPHPDRSEAWNRGAYLVEGPGHCGACHTPKNFAGADQTSRRLHGGTIQNWFAPKIAGGLRDGVGGWHTEDIVEYLKTGRNKHSGATGLMAEVVKFSTSKLPEEDLRAIALYLKDIDGGAPAPDSEKPANGVMAAGEAIYRDSCAACHQTNGKGVPRMFPPLAGNALVQSREPTTVVRVILEGAQTVQTKARPTPSTMPAFNWKLSDKQIAAVATYIRNAWGNATPGVTSEEVHGLREKLEAKTH